MKITVYVPCHNGEQTLPEVLQALKSQSRIADQYLLINDRSTDRSIEIAGDLGFEVYATGPVHFGLAAGRNAALRHARGDILAGVDADAVAEPNYLAEIEAQFARRPEIVGLCGCLQEKHTHAFVDLWRSIHMRQHFGGAEVNDPLILFGSCSAHRVKVVRKLGGWNVRFQTNYEDADLTKRIRAAGMRILYAPACRLWHLRRDTLESVLKGYWNWEYPPFDLDGSFDTLENWMTRRLPWIWQDYRYCRVVDRATPKIAMITSLLPWSTIVRDLHVVSRRTQVAWNLNIIAEIAHQVFEQCGAHPSVALWVGNWLRALVAELPPGEGEGRPLDGRFLHKIEAGALQSVPDVNYWNAVHYMFTASP